MLSALSDESNSNKIGLAIYEGDNNDKIVSYQLHYVNNAHEHLTGLKKDDILGKTMKEIIPYIEISNMKKLEHAIKTGEPVKYERYQKTTNIYYEIIAMSLKNTQLIVIINDITERKQSEVKIQYLNDHDQLTGLFNRRFFEKELLRLDNERNLPITITMADINGLKLINDSFGHPIGDKLIKKVAKVIKNGCRRKDIISRLSGDEFVIISPNTDERLMEQIIDKIKKIAANEKVGPIYISISFGYATKMHKEESTPLILKNAEDQMYRNKLIESKDTRGNTLNAIIRTLNEKNEGVELHTQSVSKLCEKMGMVLGFNEDKIKELKTTALFHDIGNIVIEDKVLYKKKNLTTNDWKEIKKHPEIGYRILSAINEFSKIAEYVLAHHERWDGEGYPKGLRGEEIPYEARIIAIAEAYDAMINERCYRPSISKDNAIQELISNAGSQFDANYVDIFINKVLTDFPDVTE